MALTAPRRLGELRPATQSRLSHKRLRAPTRVPERMSRGLFDRVLDWLLR